MIQADRVFLEASLHRNSSGDGVAFVQGSLACTDNEKKKKVEHSIFFLPWLCGQLIQHDMNFREKSHST